MDIVTGSTGLLGNVLIRELKSRGRDVKAFLRKTSDTSCFDGFEVEKVYGDILDIDSLYKAFAGANHVYHTASEISIMPGPDKRLREINIAGTKNVIKASVKCNVKRLIYTSSIHAFKEPPDGIIIDESAPFDTGSKMGEYNRTKAEASLAVLEAANNGLDTVVVCPTALVGPNDYKPSLIGSMIRAVLAGRQKAMIEGAYDFVDVRDVAIGHLLAAQKGRRGHVYILSGQRATLSELMKILEKYGAEKVPKQMLPYWIVYPAALLAPLYSRLTKSNPVFTTYSLKTVRSNSTISHKKASEELGFCPRPLAETIMQTVEWLRDNNFI